MSDNTFMGEMQRLLQSAQQPGPMYAGWQNPLTDPNDKAPNGVYATPFDRQGGPAVAEQELRTQIAGVLSKFVGTNYDQSAIDEVLRILKGTNQSPADRGGGNAPVTPVTQDAYGSMLSAPATVQTAPQQAQFSAAPNGMPQEMWVRFNQIMAADDERRKKEDEDRKKEEEDSRRKSEMSAMLSEITPQLAEVVRTAVAASVDARFSELGFQVPTQMSQTPPSQQQAQTQQPAQAGPFGNGGQSGLAFQANNQMSNPAQQWQSLQGVQLPIGSNPQAASMSGEDGMSPSEQKATLFAQNAKAKMSAMQPDAASRLSADVRSLYVPIAMGLTVTIDDPLVQAIAKESGVAYQTLGFGGVN